MPPSKLIITNMFSPRFLFKFGGVNYEGGRSNQKPSFMRGVIVPPSKLIVTTNPPFFVFIRVFFIKGGRLVGSLCSWLATRSLEAVTARLWCTALCCELICIRACRIRMTSIHVRSHFGSSLN